MQRPSRPWTRSSPARLPIPTRGAWSAITGCARRSVRRPRTSRREIKDTLQAIKDFAFSVHAGKIAPRKRARFHTLLSIGIGGSALGPQFIAEALGAPGADKIKPYFLDNTDPDGIDRVLAEIGEHLKDTLTIVISKSGGTMETRNGMLEVAAAYRNARAFHSSARRLR